MSSKLNTRSPLESNSGLLSSNLKIKLSNYKFGTLLDKNRSDLSLGFSTEGLIVCSSLMISPEKILS